MIPTTAILDTSIEDTEYATKTYQIHIDKDRISGSIDDVQALMQSIYLMLNVERYAHIIYSWDYGVELVDLFGKPMPYVMSEVQTRIHDVLIQDDRISDVKDFEFERNGKKLLVTFTVVSNYGTLQVEKEVEV